MTIEKRPNAIADKTAPSQAPRVPAVESPGGGPKLPGPPARIDRQHHPPFGRLLGLGRLLGVGHSGPEIPPSFRIRQKWTARNTAASSGNNMMWST